jgi:hypothetical protein
VRAKVIIERRDQIKMDEKHGECGTVREKGKACGVLMGKNEGRHHLENLRVVCRILLEWIFKK